MQNAKKASAVRLVQVSANRAGQRLDNFVLAQLPGLPRSAVYRVIRKGQVRINGGRARPDSRLREGDQVRIPPALISERGPAQVPENVLQRIRESIHFAHSEFLLLDKPAGLAVHGGSGIRWGVIDALRHLYPAEEIELVHRLDRDTSGCLLVTRNPGALRVLRAQFRLRSTEKRYLCLTQGRFREDRQVVDAPLAKSGRTGDRYMTVSRHGKQAVTEFRLLEHYGRHSFVEAVPLTGRTHQIRAHAAFLGIPLAGDSRYGKPSGMEYWKSKGLQRLFLHAHALAFQFPDAERQQFSVPLPDELRQVLDALRA